MPELAEVCCTADYINTVCKGLVFTSIRKGKSRHKEILMPFDSFSILAASRGKELKLLLYDHLTKEEHVSVVFGLGMSGSFKLHQKHYVHCRISFVTADNQLLSFIDPRGFGRWNMSDWDSKRSPDPVWEYGAFHQKVMQNINTTAFKKPIYEVLLNQEYFNGIGNYLRAEILGRIDASPFVSAKEYIEQHPEVLELCRSIPTVSYNYKKEYGLKWNDAPEPFLLYYKNAERSNSIVDKNGRTFWYDKKWSPAI